MTWPEGCPDLAPEDGVCRGSGKHCNCTPHHHCPAADFGPWGAWRSFINAIVGFWIDASDWEALAVMFGDDPDIQHYPNHLYRAVGWSP